MEEKGSCSRKVDWPAGDWYLDYGSPVDLIAMERKRVVARGRTRYQSYEVFENPLWGLSLILDDRLQSAQTDEFIYHEALVHPVMTGHPQPQRVLVVGGGEGATLREVLKHNTVTAAVMVDIDEELVAFCRESLPTFHGGAFDDPRVQLVFADGRGWLAEAPDDFFDVIIIDLPEPVPGGPAVRLFTREMYELVRQKLAHEGLMVVQSGSAGIWGQMMPDLNRTLREVFPRVVAYTAFVPSFMDLYGFHLAGSENFVWPLVSEVAVRLAARGVTGLRWFSPEYSASLPLLPVYLKERLVKLGRVLTDAAPFGPRPGERLFF